jgi:hypothetical protein
MSENEDPRALREIAASLLEIASKAMDPKARDECIHFAIHYHERALEAEGRRNAAAAEKKTFD